MQQQFRKKAVTLWSISARPSDFAGEMRQNGLKKEVQRDNRV